MSKENPTNKNFDEIPEKKVTKPKKADKIKLLVDEIREKYGLDVELSKNVKYKIEKVTEFINNKFDFRYNVINTDTEYKLKTENDWKYFDDRDYRTVFLDLKYNNISVSDQDFKALIYGKTISKEFNPFKEYLGSLKNWDGQTDYIRKYCEQVYLPDEETREYFVSGFKKWFVALVMSLITDEPSMFNINQTCLVLVGGQGKFKTTWIKNIVPKQLQLKYFYGATFEMHNKDHEKYLAYKMIINLDEMAALANNRVEIESVKSKITQDQIVLRLPYGKADIHLKRRASFTATNNNFEFLKDDTGSRRWFVVKIDRIVIDDSFDVDPMFAQAIALYKAKHKYWFDQEDIVRLEKENKQFQLRGFEFQLIEQRYLVPSDDQVANNEGGIKFVKPIDVATDLANIFNKININSTVTKNIASAFRELGFKQYKRKLKNKSYPDQYWAVIENPSPRETLAIDENGNEIENNVF